MGGTQLSIFYHSVLCCVRALMEMRRPTKKTWEVGPFFFPSNPKTTFQQSTCFFFFFFFFFFFLYVDLYYVITNFFGLAGGSTNSLTNPKISLFWLQWHCNTWTHNCQTRPKSNICHTHASFLIIIIYVQKMFIGIAFFSLLNYYIF